MAPLVSSFPASELPSRSQVSMLGKVRKDFGGDLKKCELMEMLQYDCSVEKPVTANSRIVCVPVERLFRKCQDRNGTFMVETTAWEGKIQDMDGG